MRTVFLTWYITVQVTSLIATWGDVCSSVPSYEGNPNMGDKYKTHLVKYIQDTECMKDRELDKLKTLLVINKGNHSDI
jgi:hypothetical protein